MKKTKLLKDAQPSSHASSDPPQFSPYIHTELGLTFHSSHLAISRSFIHAGCTQVENQGPAFVTVIHIKLWNWDDGRQSSQHLGEEIRIMKTWVFNPFFGTQGWQKKSGLCTTAYRQVPSRWKKQKQKNISCQHLRIIYSISTFWSINLDNKPVETVY